MKAVRTFLRRFHLAPFLTASLVFHLVLFFALPLRSSIQKPPERTYYKVDLVAPPVQQPTTLRAAPPQKMANLKKTKTTESKKPASKLKKKKSTRTAKKKASESSSRKLKEATVSLNGIDPQNIKYSSYLAHLRYKIDSVWQYPPFAQKEGIEGRLTLRFSLDRAGTLVGVNILQDSGHPILDRESLRTIREAAPFNPIPKGFNLDRLNVLASFQYQYSAE